MPFPTGGCRAGLAAKVNILSGEVKAKAAGDTDKDGVIRVSRPAGSQRSSPWSVQQASDLAAAETTRMPR
jgi:hypothetical protein